MSWTCQRQSGGERCRHVNENRKRLCVACGKPRPARKRPAHLQALRLSYEHYVELNGGVERCAICDREPSETRRLDRDHSHSGDGLARGLLCQLCNRMLPERATPAWLRRAADYLEAAERRAAAEA